MSLISSKNTTTELGTAAARLIQGARHVDGGLGGRALSSVTYSRSCKSLRDAVSRPQSNSPIIPQFPGGYEILTVGLATLAFSGAVLYLLRPIWASNPAPVVLDEPPPQNQTITPPSLYPPHDKAVGRKIMGGTWQLGLTAELHKRLARRPGSPPPPPPPPRAERGDCVICLDHEAWYCFKACGHLCLCNACLITIRNSGFLTCPVCRRWSESVMRVYRPI